MLVQSLKSQCPGVKEALLIVKISESGLKSLHGFHPMNKPDGAILSITIQYYMCAYIKKDGLKKVARGWRVIMVTEGMIRACPDDTVAGPSAVCARTSDN
jgi:hypothetical protein